MALRRAAVSRQAVPFDDCTDSRLHARRALPYTGFLRRQVLTNSTRTDRDRVAGTRGWLTGVSARPIALALLVLTFAVLLVRLPFVRQAVQLDDVYYLTGAQYAQTDPLHPHHAHYVFEGELEDMRGHPHPPLNTWVLALLIGVLRGIHFTAFHVVWMGFSWLAAVNVYLLARRFTRRPMMATLMFLAMPVFWIEGNSLMADLPFLVLWTGALVLFLRAVDEQHEGYLAASGAVLILAGITAYQAVFLIPLLWLWLWRVRRDWILGWYVAALPIFSAAGYQVFERITGGTLPAQVLTAYLQLNGMQSAANKVRNAAGLTVHLAWLVFPLVALYAFGRGRKLAVLAGTVAAMAAAMYDQDPLFWGSFGVGVLILASLMASLRTRGKKTRYLAAATLIFFAGSLVVFFAGAARYLLPAAPFIVFLAVRRLHDRPGWLTTGIVLQVALAACLAVVNAAQLNAWREFAASVAPEVAGKQLWINGTWGFSWYLERLGGHPVLRNQRIVPGDLIATSGLGLPVPVNTLGAKLELVREQKVAPALPLTVMGVNAKSGYVSTAFGLRPFEISRAPLDVMRLERARPNAPTLEFLRMDAPESSIQIVSGVYDIESGRQWRWMSRKAVLALKSPAWAKPVEVRFFVPAQSPVRRVVVAVDDAVLESREVGPGDFTIRTAPVRPAGDAVLLTITVDQTFRAPGDARDLGMVLVGAGFAE
jgi:Dolichyl-phosphate-mannose-protein mannosyltransferase